MNIEEIIQDLRQELQNLQDTKDQISEAQERIRESICQLEMLKESAT